jgi:hypothetical protein
MPKEDQIQPSIVMAHRSIQLTVLVLFLGWSFDFLFWRRPLGINFVIFASVCLIGGFYILISSGLHPAARGLFLLVPLVFFGLSSFVRNEPLTSFLTHTLMVFSMGLLAITYLGGRWWRYGLLDYVKKFFLLGINLFLLPLDFSIRIEKERKERGMPRFEFPIGAVVRGLLIAAPIVIFFAALLSSADLVFNQKLADFMGLFSFERLIEYVYRILLIFFWAYVLAGAYLHAAFKSTDEKLIGEEKPVIKPFLGFTETSIVLGSVVLLFLIFVVIQFRYFFGGNANIGIEGFTYSEYARRGFNELLSVAFFSLLMILGLSTITRRESAVQRRVYSGLSVALLLLVLVILVSAYQRLTLAIFWHGFSRLRLYPRVFLIWVGILFVGVVVLEIFRRECYFALAAILASIGFAASLCLVNVDASIVRRNVERASQGLHFNFYLLATLSTDAIPALADEFQDPRLPVSTHEEIGVALLCAQNTGSMEDLPSRDWRSFNYSQWRAQKAIAEIESQLEGFRVNDTRWPVRVRTPSDILYECKE